MAVADRRIRDAFATRHAAVAGPPAPHEQVPRLESDGTLGAGATA